MQTTPTAIATHYICLAVRGPNALAMLNGQCTQAVKSLDDRHAPLAGFCSTKGRLIASGRIWATQDGACIVTVGDVVDALTQHLTPFARLARVELDRDPTPVSLQLADQPLEPGVLHHNGSLWQIGEHGGTCWVFGRDHEVQVEARLAHIEAGFTLISEAIRDRFLPQQLHYPLLHGVNFQKGCYTGQEVVARLEHLGKVKRYAQRLDSPDTLSTGQEITVEQWTGEVVDTVSTPTGSRALVVIDANAQSEQLRGVPFTIQPVVPRQRP